MLVGRECLVALGAARVGDDRAFGNTHGVYADALVPAGRSDDVAVEGQAVDARGGAQEVRDARRVILPVFARERRQEGAQRASVRATQVGEAGVVSRIPAFADVGREEGRDVAVVEPVHGAVEALAQWSLLGGVLAGKVCVGGLASGGALTRGSGSARGRGRLVDGDGALSRPRGLVVEVDRRGGGERD